MAWQVIAIWLLVLPMVWWFWHDEQRRDRAMPAQKSQSSTAVAIAGPVTLPGLSPAYLAFLQRDDNAASQT
ncbi:MAG: hypothetical protein JWR39_1964 [Devosia sp.]|nr:hypothetical protein [Devosia sp.]